MRTHAHILVLVRMPFFVCAVHLICGACIWRKSVKQFKRIGNNVPSSSLLELDFLCFYLCSCLFINAYFLIKKENKNIITRRKKTTTKKGGFFSSSFFSLFFSFFFLFFLHLLLFSIFPFSFMFSLFMFFLFFGGEGKTLTSSSFFFLFLIFSFSFSPFFIIMFFSLFWGSPCRLWPFSPTHPLSGPPFPFLSPCYLGAGVPRFDLLLRP